MTESQAQKRAEELANKIFVSYNKAQIVPYCDGYMAAWHDQQKVIEKLVEAIQNIFNASGDPKIESLCREALKQWKEGGNG